MTRARPCLLVLLTLTAACAGRGAAGREPAAPQPGRFLLRVATYNIHHGAGNDSCTTAEAALPPAAACGLDLDRIAAVIRAFDADVVALQEVDRFWGRSGGTDQPALLGRALDMATCYGANLVHQADSHAPGRHEYGTLVLSRHPIVSCRNTHLPRPGDTEQRGLLEAVIRTRGASIRIFNTHLHTSNPARELQAKVIPGLIGPGDQPVVLMGDFNAVPDAAELSPLVARFADAWALAGQGPGLTSPASPDAPATRRIDYVFVSSGSLAVASADVIANDLTRMASDHLPVVAGLVISPAP